MPHFGSRVIGKQAYDHAVALEKSTESFTLGPRVTGKKAPGPVPSLDTERPVRDVLADITAGRDLSALADAELSRATRRPTVIKALLKAGANRGMDALWLDRLSTALVLP